MKKVSIVSAALALAVLVVFTGCSSSISSPTPRQIMTIKSTDIGYHLASSVIEGMVEATSVENANQMLVEHSYKMINWNNEKINELNEHYHRLAIEEIEVLKKEKEALEKEIKELLEKSKKEDLAKASEENVKSTVTNDNVNYHPTHRNGVYCDYEGCHWNNTTTRRGGCHSNNNRHG